LWNECVVPFTVEVVATQCAPFEAFHLLIGDLDALGVVAVSSSACTVSSVREVVAAMVLTMTSWLSSGPRQFIKMCENSRCSILFHLDVSGRQVADGDAEGGLVGEVASFGIAAAVDDEAGPYLAEAGRSGSPPDKHSGDRQRGATQAARLRPGRQR
jgi:hypothetical protein